MLFAAYVAGVVTLAILPLVFLIARHAAKRSKHLSWSIDDTLLVLALMLLYLVVAAFFFAMAASHVRQHVWTATMENLRMTLFVLWLFRIPMAVGLALTRCAISIFFIRILYTQSFPWLRLTAYSCICVSILLCIITVLGLLLHCRPLKYNWTPPFRNSRHCFNLEPFVIAMAALGLAVDALTWILPHCVVWSLQLRRAHKIAITAIFATGILNIIIGAFRIQGLTIVAYGSDITYGIGTTLMWAVAQMSTGIIVACSLHLRPVLEKLIPKRFTYQHTIKLQAPRSRHSSIRVTTRIDIHDRLSSEQVPTPLNDGHQAPWGPTFHVEQRPATSRERIACCL